MRSKSTEKMQMIKAFAEKYYRSRHTSPTIREIAEGTGISRASVQRYLVEMDERGMLVYRGHARAASPAAGDSRTVRETVSRTASDSSCTADSSSAHNSRSGQTSPSVPEFRRSRKSPSEAAGTSSMQTSRSALDSRLSQDSPSAEASSLRASTPAARFPAAPISPSEPRANASVIVTGEIEKCMTGYFSAPIVGSIRCGDPENEQEQVEEYVSLPESIFGRGESYLLHAVGDSMTDAGIDEGDLLVIHMQQTARVGDIVVALDQDNQNTLKRYGGRDKESGMFRLEYMNEECYPGKVIEVPEFVVQGVVRHVIKSL